MVFQVSVEVGVKDGVLDPESRTIANVMVSKGYKVENMKLGKVFRFLLDCADEKEARRESEEICTGILANTVIEDYSLRVEEWHDKHN